MEHGVNNANILPDNERERGIMRRLLGRKKKFVVSGNPTDPSFYPPTLKILWTYLC